MMHVYTLLFVIWTSPVALGYSNGLVSGSCGTMVPNHSAQPQTATSPYTVTVDRSSYQAGDTITVTLQGQSTTFMGFLLQAQEVGGSQPVGTFSVTDGQAQLLSCSGTTSSAVSHTSASSKSSVKVLWRAPASESYKDIVFRTTFVQSKRVFWVQVNSATVSYTGSQPATPVPTVSYSFISSASCGYSKLCVSQPSNCDPATSGSCNFISVLASSTNSTFNVEISGQASGYVAVGFSDDQYMGNDDIYICVDSGSGSVQVQHAYSTGTVTPNILPQGNISITKTSMTGGIISCSFTSQNTISTQPRSAASALSYYLLFASGQASGGSIQFHTTTFSSSQKVDLTSPQLLLSGSSEPPIVKAHGALMLISWMTTGSIGMLIARYLKAATKGKRCCNKDFWFLAHVTLMSLSVIATSIAFILIFSYFGGWSGGSHPVLGCIVMILALIQPMAAAFRCTPGHKWRFVFNWAHALNALVIKILAVAAIFTGLGLIDTTDSRWLQKVMGGFFAWEVLSFLLYELNVRLCAKDKTEPGSDSKSTEVIFLIIFVLGNVTFLVALLCGIGQS
uniref:Zgc:163022 n=1 Tax=Scleropages formosus TaxID=113540 RepID=A0A8C9U1X0_SCLFO